MMNLLVDLRLYLVAFVLGGVVFRWGPEFVVGLLQPKFSEPAAEYWDAPPPVAFQKVR